MKRIIIFTLFSLCIFASGLSQSKVMTPEQLIELNRVSAVGLTNDGQQSHFQNVGLRLGNQ